MRISAILALMSLAPAVQAQDFTAAEVGETIRLTPSMATTLDFAQPFTETVVADPEIADISALSDRLLYVVGRSGGVTTLSLLRPSQEPVHYRIVVAHDVGPVLTFAGEAIPGLLFERSELTLFLSGCVATPDEAAALGSVNGALEGLGYMVVSAVASC